MEVSLLVMWNLVALIAKTFGTSRGSTIVNCLPTYSRSQILDVFNLGAQNLLVCYPKVLSNLKYGFIVISTYWKKSECLYDMCIYGC